MEAHVSRWELLGRKVSYSFSLCGTTKTVATLCCRRYAAQKRSTVSRFDLFRKHWHGAFDPAGVRGNKISKVPAEFSLLYSHSP